MQYNNLNYTFQINNVSFQVSMIAIEKFERSVPAHSHGKDCYEIHYIIDGCGIAVIDGKSYPIDKNTLYITGPYIVHEQIPYKPDPMVEFCIYLRIFHKNKKEIKKGSVAFSFEENPFWFGHDSQNINSLIQTVLFEIENKNMGYQAVLQSLFQQLAILVTRNFIGSELVKPVSETVYNGYISLLEIEEALLYDYNNITLSKLAERMNISPRQVERLFKQYYDSTFQKKRTEARMSAACVLLKYNKYSIAKIAEITGYSTSEHFSYAFKKYFDINASEYRKNL